MFNKLNYYSQLIRLDRPIGTFLLLWPTLWGLWVAGGGSPDAKIVLIFTMGVFLMRSAGCVINDIADKDIDPHVSRTRERPIASGKVKPREAMVLFIVLCLVALVLVLNLNTKAMLYSLVGLLLTICYPFMKRITHLPQLFLGVAFAWAIPMGFVAQTNSTTPICWWLALSNVIWVIAYDTMYAMADKEDDLKIGVKSSAILFGKFDIAIVTACQIAVLLILINVANSLNLNGYFYACLAVGLIFNIYQAKLYYSRKPQHCFRAFLNNAWFGASVFAGFLLAYLP